MRFLSMIRINENSGQVPSEQLMHDMGKLIEEMTREGALTGEAKKAGHRAPQRAVGAVATKSIAAIKAAVLGASGPGAEGWPKQLHALDGRPRPVHGSDHTTSRATPFSADLPENSMT